MNIINFKYQLQQEVYLKTDIEQRKRLVTEIKVQPSGIVYTLSCGTQNTDHYDFEISTVMDEVLKMNS